MLAFLPLFVWVALWLLWLDWAQGQKDPQELSRSIRSSTLFATICWGAALALITEAGSTLHILNRAWVALAWTAILGILCLIGLRAGRFRRGGQYLQRGIRQIYRIEWLFIALIGILSSALLVILLLSPPNNTDSLQYHLARVVHWAQNASLGHYATAVIRQISNPIWAEEVILHMRLLWGNDGLAGLVQWGAMLGSLTAVTLIAAELGVGRLGQWIAAAFAFSLPMGVLQSTSTQNDYVVAFWLLCVAWLVLRASAQPFNRSESILLGMAVGLGMLTKGIFYPFVFPFGVWFLIAALRWGRQQQLSWGQSILQILPSSGWILLTVVILNIGYWLRNWLTFGGPLGPGEWVSTMVASQYGLGPFAASLIRNAAMNFATPSLHVNALIVQILRNKLTPLDPRMAEFDLLWGWNHEDIAGNPLHVVLIALALLILLFSWRRVKDRRLWAYLAALGGVYAMLSSVIHFELYGVRFQLPLFILGAPLVGAALGLSAPGYPRPSAAPLPTGRRRARSAADIFQWTFILILLAACLPWVLFNRTRPLIALKDGGEPFSIPCQRILGCTVGSILFEPPTTILFANWISQRDPYLQASRDLKESGCQQIGLRLDSHNLEYPFWWLLDAPQSGVRLESIYTLPEMERYLDPAFHPCAIICTICADRTNLHGLPLVSQYGDLKLFMGPGFTPQPDP